MMGVTSWKTCVCNWAESLFQKDRGDITPLLANVHLHYVLDVWFELQVKPWLRGRAFLIRYADGFVIGFACEEDARRVLEVLPKRFRDSL